jgi:NAD-dependent dihydropyrimidine dehydrogenase PreA subunit
MAYGITDSCIKDLLCVDACPTDCIHPKKDEPAFEAATQLYVDPSGCIDCGACVPRLYVGFDTPARGTA